MDNIKNDKYYAQEIKYDKTDYRIVYETATQDLNELKEIFESII